MELILLIAFVGNPQMAKLYYKSKVSNHFSQIILNCLYVSFLIAIIFSTSRYCFTKLCQPGIVGLFSFSLQT